MKLSNINFLTLTFLALVGIFLWGYYDLTQDCNQETCNYREQILKNQQEYLALQTKKYNTIALLEKYRKDSVLFQKSVQALKTELEQDTIAWRSGAETVMKDTKSLIDLHLNAVDHQYNSLTLWTAVITILFLIFSFYAIFKLEDTLKQAKEAVNGFEDEANKKIIEVKQEADQRIKEIQQATIDIQNRAQTETQKIIDEAETKNKEMKEKSDTIIDELMNSSNQHLQDLETKANKLIRNLSAKAKAGTEEITKEANKQKEAIELSSEGIEFFNNKEYEKAIVKFEKAANLDPTDASVFNKWGVTLTRLAQLNEDSELLWQSFSKFEEATKLKSNYFEAYNNWGNALVRLGRLNDDASLVKLSFSKYEKAIELNPNYAGAYYNWGLAIYRLARLNNDIALIKQSFTKFEKAIDLNPSNVNTYKNYVNAIWRLSRMENKFESYKNKLEILLFKIESLKESEGTYNLARLYSLLKDTVKALEWLEKYLNKYSKVSSRSKYEEERDFNNIKSDPRFKALLDRYYPENEEPDAKK